MCTLSLCIHQSPFTFEPTASTAVQLALTLRSYLATRLPEYMVPAAFVQLNAFPLTANGKLDRRALPNPGDNDYARQGYEEPQGEVELILASIWAELLHVERVGRHDSFFALGGHSLLAVRLMNRLSKLGTNISLSSLFHTPTLAALATVVSESISHGSTSPPAITLVPRDAVLPLSFAQQRLWFLAHLEGGSEAYHIPTATHLRGRLNQSAWKQAWEELYARHEALRSVIFSSNGQPQVRILPSEGIVVLSPIADSVGCIALQAQHGYSLIFFSRLTNASDRFTRCNSSQLAAGPLGG